MPPACGPTRATRRGRAEPGVPTAANGAASQAVRADCPDSVPLPPVRSAGVRNIRIRLPGDWRPWSLRYEPIAAVRNAHGKKSQRGARQPTPPTRLLVWFDELLL